MIKTENRHPFLSVILAIAPIVLALLCLGIGRYQLTPMETIETLLSPFTGKEVEAVVYSTVIKVRLPRVILALAVGSGLAVSGAAFQSLFSNPLATPDTLGVATGASFGAVLTMLYTDNMVTVQIVALIMGLLALVITVMISKMTSEKSMIMIVLGGMVVSSLFQALVSLVKYVADTEDQLPTITYWLMGSLSKANFNILKIGLPFIIAGIVMLVMLRWRLNILALQEDEAKSLGVNIKQLRGMVMIASTLITASCVSMCGQVGWVGLLIPHVARMLYGSDNKVVLPASIAMGASFMVIIDTVARAATAAEIPAAILTALIGAPFFIVLLRKTGGAKL